MTQEILFSRHIPLTHHYDVVVAGGGPAGIAAAVAAARLGADTLLVEQSGILGGMGTAGLMTAFIGMTDGIHVLMGGIGKEIVSQLRCCNSTNIYDTPDNWDFIPFDGEELKRLYDRLVLQSGVTLMLHTKVFAAEVEDGQVQAVILSSPEGVSAVSGGVFIDTTGDAMLSVACGVTCQLGDEKGETQAPTMVAYYAGINFDRYHAMLERTGQNTELKLLVEQAYNAGDISYLEHHIPGAFRIGQNTAVVNIGHVYGADCSTAQGLTRATIRGREIAAEFFRFYQKYVEGFENAVMICTGSILGVRETRRIEGIYRLNVGDFLARAKFDDEIGRFSYAVDVHRSVSDRKEFERFNREYTKDYKYGKGESYGIPYRCLLPKQIKNLLVAGRCISADRQMQGSTRVMPCCFITGQAAGTAAILSVKAGCHPAKLDISLLQDTLRKSDCYLP